MFIVLLFKFAKIKYPEYVGWSMNFLKLHAKFFT